MTPKDTHEWLQLPINGRSSPYYYCRVCRVSGKRIGQAWPPIRDPKFIGPEYQTCEGAKRQRVADDLKKYGVQPEDLEP